MPSLASFILLPSLRVSTARLRVGLPCTRNQRQAASLDTVRPEWRSVEKRGRIYRTGSLAKGTHEAHRFPCRPADIAASRAVGNVQGTQVSPCAPRTDPSGRC